MDSLLSKIQLVEDFPKSGVDFRDFMPIFKDPATVEFMLQKLIDLLGEIAISEIQVVVGLESRGIWLGIELAKKMNKPFIPIRKDKTPPPCLIVHYGSEYEKENQFQLSTTALNHGQLVLIVDDMLATGETLKAAYQLIKLAGAIPYRCLCLMEIEELFGRKNIAEKSNIVVETLIVYSIKDKHAKPKINTCREKKIIHYQPVNPPQLSMEDTRPILISHPSMQLIADQLLEQTNYRQSHVSWDVFPNGVLNTTFEDIKTLRGRDITVIMNAKKETWQEVTNLLIALSRQDLHSLTILLPFFESATYERVDIEGKLACAEPILKILSACFADTHKKTRILCFDIHSIVERFYTTSNALMTCESAIPVFIKKLKMESETLPTIVFPDKGAYDRFKYKFEEFPKVVCGKVRSDNGTVVVIITSTMNFPKDPKEIEKCKRKCFIVDDLVMTGGTLLECKDALVKDGYQEVNAYVTHAVFPNQSWKKFIASGFKRFITTDSNPEVTKQIIGIIPFEIIPIVTSIIPLLMKMTMYDSVPVDFNCRKSIHVYVASADEYKLEAVLATFEQYQEKTNGVKNCIRIFGVEGIESGVPNQPIENQGEQGSFNRLKELYDITTREIAHNENKFQHQFHSKPKIFLVSIQNGLCSCWSKQDRVDGLWKDKIFCNICRIEIKQNGKKFLKKRIFFLIFFFFRW
jgi:adenine phosphoribosyltransferase